MTALSLTYTITNGTTEDAVQVQQNYTDIKNYINSNTMRTDGANPMAAALSTNNVDPTADAHAVRKAYVDGPVVVATGGVTQTFAVGVAKTILFSTEVRDADNGLNTANNYNLATGLFTAPKTGLYIVAFSISRTRYTNVDQLSILAGGTQYFGPSYQNDSIQSINTVRATMCLPLYLTVAQTVEPQLNATSGSAGVAVGNYLSIAWLHA